MPDSIDVGITPYKAIGIVTLVRVAVWMGNSSILSLAPFLQTEWQLSRLQVGTLASALFLGALLATMPGGWCVDRFGSRRMLIVALLLEGSFLAISSKSGSFSQMLLCSCLAGLGQGLASPALSKAVATWAPRESRATVMGIEQTGIPIGAGLAAAVLPSLATASSWRGALALAGLTIAAVASLALWFYRDRVVARGPAQSKSDPVETWYQVITNRNLLLASAVFTLFVFVQFCFASYLLLFLNERLGWTVTLAGFCLASTQMGGIGGRVGWGLISDRSFHGRRRPIFAMVALLAAAMAGLLALATPQYSIVVIFLVALFVGVSAYGWGGMQMAMVTDLAGLEKAGVSIGLSVGFTYLGIIGGPPFFGYLVDTAKSYSQAWFAVALVALLALVPLALVREKSIPLKSIT